MHGMQTWGECLTEYTNNLNGKLSTLTSSTPIGGWVSIYIEIPLRAMDLKSLLLLLMSSTIDVKALMFTDNTRFHYQNRCIILTYVFSATKNPVKRVCGSQYILNFLQSVIKKN